MSRNLASSGRETIISEHDFAGTIVALVLVGWIAPLLYMHFYLGPAIRHFPSTQWGNAAELSARFYPASVFLFFLLTLGLVIALPVWAHPGRLRFAALHRLLEWRQLSLGALAGLSVFGISTVLHIPGAELFTRTVLLWPPVFPAIFLLVLVVGLPITTEIVFRKLLMGFLLENGGAVVAVMVVSYLFAMVWPVFGFWVGLALGGSCSLIYHGTRSLIACIFADMTATTLIAIHLIWSAAASMK